MRRLRVVIGEAINHLLDDPEQPAVELELGAQYQPGRVLAVCDITDIATPEIIVHVTPSAHEASTPADHHRTECRFHSWRNWARRGGRARTTSKPAINSGPMHRNSPTSMTATAPPRVHPP